MAENIREINLWVHPALPIGSLRHVVANLHGVEIEQFNLGLPGGPFRFDGATGVVLEVSGWESDERHALALQAFALLAEAQQFSLDPTPDGEGTDQ